MLLLKAYNAIYKYDFICLSETYLDSSIPSDHVSLELEGYKVVCADDTNNVKRGGFVSTITNLYQLGQLTYLIFKKHYS